MAKPPPKPLGSGTLWKQDAVFLHRGVKIRCVLDGDATVVRRQLWRVGSKLFSKADYAMDHAEGRKAPTTQDELCAVGLHSWVDATGVLPADTKCSRCDELYGDPQ